jgi:hypothetical protein
MRHRRASERLSLGRRPVWWRTPRAVIEIGLHWLTIGSVDNLNKLEAVRQKLLSVALQGVGISSQSPLDISPSPGPRTSRCALRALHIGFRRLCAAIREQAQEVSAASSRLLEARQPLR